MSTAADDLALLARVHQLNYGEPDEDDSRWEAYERRGRGAATWSGFVADLLRREGFLTDMESWEAVEEVGRLEALVDHVESGMPDLAEFLAGEEAPYRWVVPGLLEAGDRLIVTGEEGRGKSTLLRQFAVMVASGLHPFGAGLIDAQRVLYIDAENSVRQCRRAFTPLAATARDSYGESRLRLHVVGHSLDLARPEVHNAVALKVQTFAPAVIVLGPLYKLTDGDPIKEEPARALADSLDALRAICGSAIVIEAHTPYADGSKAKRVRRPYGASLWSRWPEFGIFLDADGTLEHWRGPRDEREWPAALERSTPWPWGVRATVAAPAAPRWDGPTQCMAAIARWLDDHPDEEVSQRAMTDKLAALDLRYRRGTVAESLERLRADARIAHRKGPRNSDLYRSNGPDQEGPEDDIF